MKKLSVSLVALVFVFAMAGVVHASVSGPVSTGKVPALAPPGGGGSLSGSSDSYSSFNIDVSRKYCSGSAVTPDNATVYVMNYDPTISVIDAVGNVFVKTIDFSSHSPGSLSGGIVVGDYLYAVGSSRVVIMDINTEVVSNTVSQTPGGGVVWGRAAASPSKDRVYTVFGSASTMLAIDTTTHLLIGSASVGNENTGIGVSPDGTKIYVSDRVAGDLTIVDAGTLGVINVKSYVSGTGIVAYTTAVSVGYDGLVYVGYVDTSYSFNVAICDADGNLLDTIYTGSFSTGLDLSKDGRYLTTGNGKIIDVITKTVVADVGTGSGEYQVNMSQDGLRAYVTNYNSTYITVIEGYVVGYNLFVNPTPIVGGQDVTFAVAGGTPATMTYLVYSTTGTGNVNVPQLGITLGIANPQLGFNKLSDGSGITVWSVTCPTGYTGPAWLQACQMGLASNVMATTVQ